MKRLPPPSSWPRDVKEGWDYLRAVPWLAFLPQMKEVVQEIDAYFRSFGDEEYRRSMDPKVGVPRHLHKPQLKFVNALARERWLVGANRIGKSFLMALEIAWMMNGVHPNPSRKVPPPPNDVWAGCPDLQNHGRRITVPMITWALGRGAGNWRWREGERAFYVKADGCEEEGAILVKSYDSGADKWQGGQPAMIAFDEAPPEDIYRESSIRISGGEFALQILGAMTPLYGAAWFHSVVHEPWEDAGCPPGKAFIGGEMRDNPHLAEEEVARLEEEYRNDPEEYRIRIKGAWTSIADRVYGSLKASDEHGPVHVIPPFEIPGVHRDPDEAAGEKAWSLYRAVDHGVRNPTAVLWVAVDPSGLCYVYREMYETDLSIREICQRVKMLQHAREVIRYTVIDPATEQRDATTLMSRIDEFAANGMVCVKGNNDIQFGVSKLKDGFRYRRDAEGNMAVPPKYRIFDCCPNTWRELRTLAWAPHRRSSPNDPKDMPKKHDDHCCDALRYLAATGCGPTYYDAPPREPEPDPDFMEEPLSTPFSRYTGY